MKENLFITRSACWRLAEKRRKTGLEVGKRPRNSVALLNESLLLFRCGYSYDFIHHRVIRFCVNFVGILIESKLTKSFAAQLSSSFGSADTNSVPLQRLHPRFELRDNLERRRDARNNRLPLRDSSDELRNFFRLLEPLISWVIMMVSY